jgi:hypothetical protein
MWNNPSASYFDVILQNRDISSLASTNKPLYVIFRYLFEIMLLDNKFKEDLLLLFYLIELEASKDIKIYSLVDLAINSSSKDQYLKIMIDLFFYCITSFEEYTRKKFANVLFEKCFIELINSED